MGWSFRKTINLGPLRLNLSRSGLGASFVLGGLRAGISAKGRKYLSAAAAGFRLHRNVGERDDVTSKRPKRP